MLHRYNAFEKGISPSGGGYDEQSAKDMEAIRLIQSEVAQWERDRRKSAEEEAAKGRKSS